MLVTLLVLLICYETLSLSRPDHLVAITYYVRCANVIHGLPTVTTAVAVSFFVGRWLRNPWWGR